MTQREWLALMIGNSRLHWAYFVGNDLQQTWNTLKGESLRELREILPSPLLDYFNAQIPLVVASVVPSATRFYLQLPQTEIINPRSLPLMGVYSTMGVDRILALWGGGCRYGFPILVIDSGTALTVTGADSQYKLIGGAILPGVKLQMETLFFNTAALPEIEVLDHITPRWALDTPSAINSGILYTLIGGIRDFVNDWLYQYPQSSIVLTGGDTLLLHQYLRHVDPFLADKIKVDADLIFYGMQQCFLNN